VIRPINGADRFFSTLEFCTVIPGDRRETRDDGVFLGMPDCAGYFTSSQSSITSASSPLV
jgi:hypothetical protein